MRFMCPPIVHRLLRSKRRRLLSLAVTVVATLMLGAAPAFAAPVMCGQIISTNTTLTTNLTCAGAGLVVAGEGTVLDLGGYTITGSGVGIGISIVSDTATVKNGTVQRFGFGVLSGLDPSARSNNTLLRLTVQENGTGIVASGVTVHATHIVRNSGNGIEWGAPSRSLSLSSSLISQNGGNGILVTGGESTGTYTNNVITNNGGNGLDAFFSTAILTGNYVSGNGENGIKLTDITGAAYELFFNTANSNGRLGILACNESIPGHCGPIPVLQANGNSASFNGDPRQCVNVPCATHVRRH